jgi:hypothetical protein
MKIPAVDWRAEGGLMGQEIEQHYTPRQVAEALERFGGYGAPSLRG